MNFLRRMFIGWVDPHHLPLVLHPRLSFLEALLHEVDNLLFVSNPTQFIEELLTRLKTLHEKIQDCQKLMDPKEPSNKVEEVVTAVDEFIAVINKNGTSSTLFGSHVPSEVGKIANFAKCLSRSLLNYPTQEPYLGGTPDRYLGTMCAIVHHIIGEVHRLSHFSREFGIGNQSCNFSLDEITVFYVTDQQLTVDCEYSGHPESNKILQYGEIKVSIPSNLRRGGKLREPLKKHAQPSLEPFVHISTDIRFSGKRDAFVTKINAHINKEACPDVLVLIHGYNSHLKKNVRRLAKLKKDLDFEGAVILYSWSSGGKSSAYYSDESNVEATIQLLHNFIWNIQQEIRTPHNTNRRQGRIYLMAHSIGNRALIGALNLRLQDHIHRPFCRENLPKISQVVFVAADETVGKFIDLVDAFRPAWEDDSSKVPTLTVYCNREDIALMVSYLHCELREQKDSSRLGDTRSCVDSISKMSADFVDVVDATGVDTSTWQHSYYCEVEAVLDDLQDIFQRGQRPRERQRLQEIKIRPGSIKSLARPFLMYAFNRDQIHKQRWECIFESVSMSR